MLVKDSKGRDVEIYFSGDEPDSIEVEDAFYVDDEESVASDEIEYIMDKYADEIYEDFCEQQITKAEYLRDSWEDR